MARRPHILFLNEFYHPDICASAVVAADHLPKIARMRPDWQVTVIAGDRSWIDPTVVYPAAGEHEGVGVIRVNRPAVSRTNLIRRALGFAAFQRSAVRAARVLEAVDLVVATTAPPQGAEIARRIAGAHQCPFVYKVLDLYPDLAAALGKTREGSLLYRRWLAADTRVMRAAARVVSIAERMTERIQTTRGLAVEKVTTIHDGFDASKLSVATPNAFARAHNPSGRFVVQYAGNMGLSHPFETILDAARRLAPDADVLFQFIGDGPQRGQLASQLPEGAQLLPYQPAERLGDVLAAADVCLISQHDAMYDKALPYKIYAILASGRPTVFVGNEKSEIAEWLIAGGAGRHVRQGEPDLLVEAITRYRDRPDERETGGAAARQLFAARFDSELSARKWVALIEELISGPRGV